MTMKNSSRPFVPGIINHCYQNTINGALLFYSVSDFLVMFTLVCVASKRYDVKVLAVCFMPDHIHGSYVAVSKRELSAFVGYYSSEYVKMFNDYYGRSGPLFNRPFGSVPKIGDKKGRTNLIYVDNNPVERRLSKDAVLYRWNFLAYGQSKHPFSEPIKRRTASSALKKAMEIVDLQSSRGHPLTFALLGKWFSRLSKKESLQLVDYIITTYSVIDYDAAARFFGGFDNMLLAIRSTTGSEYDLNEPFEGRNDSYYAMMSAWLLKTGRFKDVHKVITLPLNEKLNLFRELQYVTNATPGQVAKYLHLPPPKKGTIDAVDKSHAQRHAILSG